MKFLKVQEGADVKTPVITGLLQKGLTIKAPVQSAPKSTTPPANPKASK